MERRLNILMPLFGAIGGVIGHFAGLFILAQDLPRPVAAACYMGAVGFFIVLGCVLAECVAPLVNGYNWRRNYLGSTFKYLVPMALVPMLLLGGIMQGLYQLDIAPRPKRDIYMLIDISGSMEWNDPENERLAAVNRLAERFGEDERLEIIAFDHEANVQLPAIEMSDENALETIRDAIGGLAPRGGTEFNVVLDLTIKRILEANAANEQSVSLIPVVILLSDGESEMNEDTLNPYKDFGIPINTVGLSLELKDGEIILENIARDTGGKFVLASNTDELDFALSEVYRPNERFILNGEPGFDALRFALFVIAGGILGFVTAFIFDNKPVTVPFTVLGIVGGLLAGALLFLPLGLLLSAVSLGFVFPFGALFGRKTS